MNKQITKVFYALALMSSLSCSDKFLNPPTNGALKPEELLTDAGIEEVLIGAYSCIKGSTVANAAIGTYATSPMNWVFGGVVGEEAFKGSNSGDQSDINPISQFQAPATNGYLEANWRSFYDGINRANSVIKLLLQAPKGAISKAEATRMRNEAYFLRGYFHMQAKMFWNNIPFVDETIDYTKGNYKIGNDKDVWPLINADLKAAMDSLGESGMPAGRANKWAAASMLAKGLMLQHSYTDAATLLDNIIANGKTAKGDNYGLNAKFRDTFDAATDNSKESIFACQSSVNDGSGAGNANADQVLNFPYLSSEPVGCCGFFQPSLDQANSYRTDPDGLPLLDGSYNTGGNVLADEIAFVKVGATVIPDAGSLDPRIDWTIGRQGVPFYDWGQYSNTWVRSFGDGGPYTPKKVTFPKTEIGTYTDNSSWTPGYSAVNFNIIRYAEILLWRAECFVDAGDLNSAETMVNMVRGRISTDPTTWVRVSDDPKHTDWEAYLSPAIASHPAGNYNIGLYDHASTGVNKGAFKDKTTALRAVHMEHKLEFGMEGHRFFDLVRWGETTNADGPITLQSAIDHNGKYVGLSLAAKFTKGKNEYFPIPQNEIDLSGGLIKQNTGQ